jgi:ADP-heptose:LPS heptosyltransferase
MTKKKKILAFRFSAMGDVAMVVPVIKSVVKQNPDIEIIMVSRSFFKAFFSNIPQVQFIGVDLKKYKGILGLFQLFRELKKINLRKLPIYTMYYVQKFCVSFLNYRAIK